MQRIDNLNDEPKQLTRIVLDDGTILQLSFLYQAATQRWVFDLLHAEFALNGIGLVLSPNLLRTFRHAIPFGISCVASSNDGVDPAYLTDFSSGRIVIYILDRAEVVTVEEDIRDAVL